MSSRRRLIPFTANIVRGVVLDKPQLIYISCPVIALGCKEFRFFDIEYNVIKMRAFTIEYKNNFFASCYFTDELWREYMSIMCSCCEPIEFTSDIDFLVQNGVSIC